MSGVGGAFRGCPTHGTHSTACRGHDTQVLAKRISDARLKALYRQGLRARVDAGPAVEHLRGLLAAGATQSGIARVGRCSVTMLWMILNGQRKLIHRDIEKLLLSLEWCPEMGRSGGSPSLGTRRRLRGLVAMGYGPKRLAEECGISLRSVVRLLHDESAAVLPSTAGRVEAASRRLIMVPGGSEAAMERARRYGWVPLAAWDDIDDPQETPKLGARSAEIRRRAIIEDTAELLARGLSRDEIAKRVGIRWDSIMAVHARSGVRLEVAS